MSPSTPPPCPLCDPDPELVFHRGALVLGLWDRDPGNGSGTLLVTKRHVSSWLDAAREEREELFSALAIAHETQRFRGYDLEIHDTPHLHVRLLPKAVLPAPLPDRVLDRPLAGSANTSIGIRNRPRASSAK